MDVINFLNDNGKNAIEKLTERGIICRHEKHLDLYILNYGRSIFLDKKLKHDP